jgi:hypothetical protein
MELQYLFNIAFFNSDHEKKIYSSKGFADGENDG